MAERVEFMCLVTIAAHVEHARRSAGRHLTRYRTVKSHQLVK